MDRFLDQPWLIRMVSSRALEISPKQLGALTVSMLRGKEGFQRKEVRRLCHYLQRTAKPHLVNLTNMLIAGCVPELRAQLHVPVLVTLQGDDIFLDELPEPYRSQAFDVIRQLVRQVDGFLVNSRYYADFMAEYFDIPDEKLHQVRLGIDPSGYQNRLNGPPANDHAATIGYLARIAPEKGLHLLVDAFIELRQRNRMQEVKLQAAGWMGKQHQHYLETQQKKLAAAGLEDDFRYVGEVTRQEKIAFLQQLDVLSVPTTYRDPKGLFVLEALAAGVPVVQPNHGAFPEWIEQTGGGRLFRPHSVEDLADSLEQILSNDELRQTLGQQGQRVVHEQFNDRAMAQSVLQVMQQFAAT
jgi:glycosyltransferase involved in cell wall biosynthesis